MGNVFKTTMLMAGLTALLVVAGRWAGGTGGMVLALAFAVVLNGVTYWFSDKMILRLYGGQEVSPADAPPLHAIIERLSAQAGIPKPKVYLLPIQSPNAFATGRNPQHAAMAVTEGLLQLLNDDELEGVVAHELAHVKNRDPLISTIAATMAGALMTTEPQNHRSVVTRSRGLWSVVLILIAPVAALLIQLAIARSREYLADEMGAYLCGKPLGLANALLKLEQAAHTAPLHSNPQTAHLFIVNPLHRKGVLNWFNTHPEVADRVRRLEGIAVQIGYLTASPTARTI